MVNNTDLVGGLEHVFFFHLIYGMSSFPLTILFKMVNQPVMTIVDYKS